MSYHKSGTINKKTQTISSVPNAALTSYEHVYNYQNNAHQVTSVGPNFTGGPGGLNDIIEYNSEGSVKKMYEEVTTPGDTNKLRKFVWNENQQLMGVRNPNGIHHYLYDANGQRIMKGSLRRNGAVLNGVEGENSYIADPYSRRDCEAKGEARRAKLARPSPPLWRDTIYVNPYYIITHYANWTEATKHYYKGSQRVAAALEADNDLSDIETSPTSIGVKTNLLNLLNMVGAQEGVDYQQQSLYGEEPQSYAQAVMSLEDYTTLINDNLEEDPGDPPEPLNQDRCTFSRYWPYEIHNLDCDPVIYFYHPDYLGHTEYITDRNGDAYQYFHYSAFGETLIEEHSGQGTHTDYFRFNGKELDPETGNYYYGARYYDPRVSQWLSVDPLAGAYPSLSPYVYVANNPINLIDPDGRRIVFPSLLTDFGWRFQKDLNKLYAGRYGRHLIRHLHSIKTEIIPQDASRWYLSNESDVLNSETRGDYPDYWRADDGRITVDYAQREGVDVAGTRAHSYLVLAHEFVHAKDIASGFFESLNERVRSGEIVLPKLDFQNEIGEVRAMIYTNKIRQEQGIDEVRTEYRGVQLLKEDGVTPIKNYGFDITEGLFDGVE